MTLNNSTVSGNTANTIAGGLRQVGGTATLNNTLLAGNLVAGTANDCIGTVTSTAGHNLIQATTGCTLTGTTTGNVIGQDPKLGALASNGGATQTRALLAGSPALDAGDAVACANVATVNSVDQRGLVRSQGAACDIGAFEAGRFTVNSANDAVDDNAGNGICHTAANECTLRAAVQESNAFAGALITFAAGVDGTPITLTVAGTDDTAAAGDLDIANSVTIAGNGAAKTIVQACDRNQKLADCTAAPVGTGVADRVFDVLAGTVSLSGMTVRNGKAAVQGGGIKHTAGVLTLTGMAVRSNTTATSGGGIQHLSGALAVSGSTISSNSANLVGGGIDTGSGMVTMTNSTVSSNAVTNLGGGLHNDEADVTLTNVTVTANTVTGGVGGGVANNTGIGVLRLVNTLVGGNTAGTGPDCNGPVTSAAGHNLIQNPAGCTLGGVVAGNIIGVDPQLAGLGAFGGPTDTHALIFTSPAVDAGDTATCIAVPVNRLDQRGTARPQGAACDIGAFEFVPAPSTGGGGGGGGSPIVAPPPNTAAVLTFDRTNGGEVRSVNVTASVPGGSVPGFGSVVLTVAEQQPGAGLPQPANGVLGFQIIEVTLRDSAGNLVHDLLQAASIRIVISPQDLALAGGDPTRLRLMRFDEATKQWVELVGAVSADGRTLTVSTQHFSTFAVVIVQIAPDLTGPAEGALVAGLDPVLTWNVPAGTRQHQVQAAPVNNDGPGVNLIIGQADLVAAGRFAVQPPKLGEGNYVLLPGMTYSWRVRTTSLGTPMSEADAGWSVWSAARTFRTGPASSATIGAVGPANGAAAESVTPVLRWANSNDRIFYYEVQVSQDAEFKTDPATATAAVLWELVHGGVPEPLNSYRVREAYAMEAGRTYFWRVRPRVQGDGTPAAWSETWSFRTP
ncbi:MAG: CSLREA domain-containing protein [Chloroflexi bacterium]|nr:CSLREA domain-containing protein [Chloroflexota bacterium]